MGYFGVKCHTNLSAVIGFWLQILHFGDLFKEVRLLHAGLGPSALELGSWVGQDHVQVHSKTCW